jgi:hypothetical protein
MTRVTVFRHVPPPIIGSVGVIPDRDFAAFEERLDWLEANGILVERFDPRTVPGEVAARGTVLDLLSAEGGRCLPLILVDGGIVWQGSYPSRTQLARAVGGVRRPVVPAIARRLAAIGAAAALGFEDEVRRQAARASEMGVPEESVRAAVGTGAGLRQVEPVE